MQYTKYFVFICAVTFLAVTFTPPISAADIITQGQQDLKDLGYAPGPIDGAFGQRTKDAVIKFQKDSGLETTGYFDSETVKKLRAALWSKSDITETKGPVLTASKSLSVSNGKYVLELEPVIITHEFEGESTTSSSAVILVFLYKLKNLEGEEVRLVTGITSDFFDKNGTNMHLPTRSSWSQSRNRHYFRTFGDRETLSSGISFVAWKSGVAKFPQIKLMLNY